MSVELQGWLGAGAGVTRRMVRVSKHGHPFLYFPPERSLALRSLDLYPPQRPAARAARAGLRALCGLGLARRLPATPFTFPTDSPATAFLADVGRSGTEPPHLAILAGNPSTPGRRYILLIYGRDGHPAAAVKVGLNERAAALVRQEAEALKTIADRTAIAPQVLALHESGTACAAALEHIAGHAPTRAAADDLARVLTPWVDTRHSVTARDIPAWRRLIEACSSSALVQTIRQRLEPAPLRPVLYHGDFAPWNVKVQTDGSWRVLDWERGELTGMPCWDWFHYHVQVGLLVDRLEVATHAQAVDRLLDDPVFCRHAETAGVRKVIRELFLAYLLYSTHLIGPKESLPAKQALLDTLTAKWKTG